MYWKKLVFGHSSEFWNHKKYYQNTHWIRARDWFYFTYLVFLFLRFTVSNVRCEIFKKLSIKSHTINIYLSQLMHFVNINVHRNALGRAFSKFLMWRASTALSEFESIECKPPSWFGSIIFWQSLLRYLQRIVVRSQRT